MADDEKKEEVEEVNNPPGDNDPLNRKRGTEGTITNPERGLETPPDKPAKQSSELPELPNPGHIDTGNMLPPAQGGRFGTGRKTLTPEPKQWAKSEIVQKITNDAAKCFELVSGSEIRSWILFEWPTRPADVESDLREHEADPWMAEIVRRVRPSGRTVSGWGISNLRPRDLLKDVYAFEMLMTNANVPDSIRGFALESVKDLVRADELLKYNNTFGVYALAVTMSQLGHRLNNILTQRYEDMSRHRAESVEGPPSPHQSDAPNYETTLKDLMERVRSGQNRYESLYHPLIELNWGRLEEIEPPIDAILTGKMKLEDLRWSK